MSEESKDAVKFWTSILLVLFGIFLAAVSLFLPPTGIIDASVLQYSAELFVFIGSVWGIGNYTHISQKKLEAKTQCEIERIKRAGSTPPGE